jgi:hypothetical protein
MAKLTDSRVPAGKADRLMKAAFSKLAAQPVPEHLIDLVDELDQASQTGRLKRSSRAA